MAYPKWMHRVHPDGVTGFQNTLVGTKQAEAELAADGWSADPHAHGVVVVPYPAEITLGGTVMHHPLHADANGNHPHGPPPTSPGMLGGAVAMRVK